MRAYFTRRQPPASPRFVLAAAFGGGFTIAVIGMLSVYAGAPALMAPFGASCVLMFSMPASPLSQPINVVGGYVISAALSLALVGVLPETWWSVALAVGLTIGLLAALRLTHPPAGANPLIIFAARPDWDFLCVPVLAGSMMLVALAVIFHRMARTPYPVEEG